MLGRTGGDSNVTATFETNQNEKNFNALVDPGGGIRHTKHY